MWLNPKFFQMAMPLLKLEDALALFLLNNFLKQMRNSRKRTRKNIGKSFKVVKITANIY